MSTLTTELCNQSLGRIGANRLAYTGTTETDLDANTTLEAIQCNLNYNQTRKSLLQSHWWGFARARAILVQDTELPAFEWAYQYKLPADYLRKIAIYEGVVSDAPLDSYDIEGDKILTNADEVSLKYVRDVTDIDEFTPLFTEILVLQLALKLLPALAGTQTAQFRKDLKQDLYAVMTKARVIDKQETNTTGRNDLRNWNDSRYLS